MGLTKLGAALKPGLAQRLFLATFILFMAATAQAKLDTAVCVACHNAFPAKAGKNLHVDASLFNSSVHAALGCQSCHSDVTAIPHQGPAREVSCGGCHPTQDSAYRRSVPASVRTRRAIPACLDCHGNPHE